MDAAVAPGGILPPGAAPGAGWSGRFVDGRGARVGTGPRGGGRKEPGASTGRLRTHQWSQSTKYVDRKSVWQRCEEHPVAGEKRGPASPSWRCRTVIWCRNAGISTSLSRALMGQQAQQRERAGHTEVGQSEQHSWSSCRAGRRHSGWRPVRERSTSLELHTSSTCIDEVIGRHSAGTSRRCSTPVTSTGSCRRCCRSPTRRCSRTRRSPSWSRWRASLRLNG